MKIADPRWPIRSSSGLQLPAKVQREWTLHFQSDFCCSQTRRFPGREAPRVASAAVLAGTACLHTKYTGPGTILAGDWSSWETEFPIQLIKRRTETGSQARRFLDKKAPQTSVPLFQPVQWVAAWEITQIPVPFQQATETPGRKSTIQLF